MTAEAVKQAAAEAFKFADGDIDMQLYQDDINSYTAEDIERLAINDRDAGRILFVQIPEYPNVTVEVVGGVTDADCIMTTYQNNGVFGDRAAVIRHRTELIKEIGLSIGLVDSNNFRRMVIKDDARGRELLLRELSTQQLIDVLSGNRRLI